MSDAVQAPEPKSHLSDHRPAKPSQSQSIRFRLLLAASIIVVVSIITIMVQWRIVAQLEMELPQAVGESVPILTSIQNLRFGTLRVVSSTSEFLLLASHRDTNKLRAEHSARTELDLLQEGRESFELAIRQFRSTANAHSPETLDEVEQAEALGRLFLDASDQLVRLAQTGADGQQVLEAKERFEGREADLLNCLSAALEDCNNSLESRRDALRSTVHAGKWLCLAASLGSILALILTGYTLSRSIAAPLRRLAQVARRIGDGDLGARALGERGDEIGSLATVLNTMATRLGSTTVSRDDLQQIIAAMSEGLVVSDGQGLIEQANPAAALLFGVPADQLVGQAITSVLGLENLDSLAPGLTDVTLQLRNGVPVFAARRLILDEDGSSRGAVFVVSDLSGRLAAEKLLRDAKEKAEASTRAKAQFLANMSHEIRTPLNGVLGMLELLGSTDLDENQDDLAKTAMRSAESLLTLLNGILDLSKAEAGKLTLETRPFDLRQSAEDVLTMFATRAQSIGIELCCAVEDGVETRLVGDPARLSQVLINLVGNAVKFTERGQVVLRISPDDGAAEAPRLRFEVRDSGCGIATDTCEMLFHEFVQADASTTRRYGGSGLGLAISKHLVGLMGGTIGVDSTIGVGSTFWFTATFARDPEHNETDPLSCAALSNFRALVVDDNADVRDSLQQQLLRWGMQNGSAPSGEVALAMLCRAAEHGKPYDVALLDMHMSGMDGLTLARAIRASPTLAKTSLVMLTSVDSVARSTASDCGIAEWVVKPIRQSELLRALVASFKPQQSARAATAETTPARCDVPSLFGARVLVAEDNVVNQKVAKGMLSALRCSVTLAPNGLAAVEAAAREHFDIILMDCQMPVMDGYGATAEIRRVESCGSGKRAPIIAMTAHAMEGDREKCLSAGMDDYLTKPLSRQRLAQMLERWVAARAAPTSAAPPQRTEAGERPSIVDRAALEALSKPGAEGEASLAESFADEYVDQATRIAADLAGMLDSGDLAALQSVAHQLRSSSAELGAQRASRAAAALEHAARDGQAIPQLRALADQLATSLREAAPVLLALARELGGRKP